MNVFFSATSKIEKYKKDAILLEDTLSISIYQEIKQKTFFTQNAHWFSL